MQRALEVGRLGDAHDALEPERVRLVPHREVGLDHDGVGIGSLASNIRPRCSSGSCDVMRTALTLVDRREPVRALRLRRVAALGRVGDLDDERDPVALGDRLAQLAHETGS